MSEANAMESVLSALNEGDRAEVAKFMKEEQARANMNSSKSCDF